MELGRAHPRFRLGEGLRETLEPQAQRRWHLDGVDDAAVLGAGGLEMGAAHVPTDRDAHVPFRAPPVLPYMQPMSSRSEVGSAMEIIPVIDLKGGAVVRARMGRRDQYRPIETPLSPTSDPVDVARGLLVAPPVRDALCRRSRRHRGCGRQPRRADAAESGISAADALGRQRHCRPRPRRDWLARGWGQLVLGSETQADAALVRHFAGDARVTLSLDFRGTSFQGPPALLDDTGCWPQKVIAMTLARVGSGAGPDLDRLCSIRDAAAGKAVYAAGGVRDAADLAALQRAGIAGALVASCLHDGRLSGEDIAAL